MKRAIFPDPKSLQPAPTANGEHANISGNINSTSQALPAFPNTQTAPNSVPATQPTGSPKNGNVFPFWALWSMVILVIIFFAVWIYRKYKRE